MAARIKIKRSGSTVSPISLAPGELAYSWANTAGGKLYIGAGDSIANNQAEFVNVIGGKYFTDKLDHVPGTLTPNSAIITDSNNRIDRLFVDNVLLDGNLISANGNLVLAATGIISASNRRLSNVAAPISSTDAVNLGHVESVYSGFLQITGDTGSESIRLLSDVLDFNGGIGVSTEVTANTVTFNLTNTGVVANTYGTVNSVSTFSVNNQGRITSAVNAPIAILSTQVTDFVEATQDTIAASFTAGTQSGLTITYDDSLGAFSFNVNDPVITLTGDVAGSATMTNLGNVSINATIQANSVALGTDTTGNYVALVSNTASSGVIVTGTPGEGATFTIAGVNATNTIKGVASFGGWADSANTVRQFVLDNGDVAIINIDGGAY
jgi:hypothetical protein